MLVICGSMDGIFRLFWLTTSGLLASTRGEQANRLNEMQGMCGWNVYLIVAER